jgi:hypothetical protein
MILLLLSAQFIEVFDELIGFAAAASVRSDGVYQVGGASVVQEEDTLTDAPELHNYPATHFGRNPPPSTIQSRHWKRRGLEPVPDPRGKQDTTLSQTSPLQGPIARTYRKMG